MLRFGAWLIIINRAITIGRKSAEHIYVECRVFSQSGNRLGVLVLSGPTQFVLEHNEQKFPLPGNSLSGLHVSQVFQSRKQHISWMKHNAILQ